MISEAKIMQQVLLEHGGDVGNSMALLLEHWYKHAEFASQVIDFITDHFTTKDGKGWQESKCHCCQAELHRNKDHEPNCKVKAILEKWYALRVKDREIKIERSWIEGKPTEDGYYWMMYKGKLGIGLVNNGRLYGMGQNFSVPLETNIYLTHHMPIEKPEEPNV
jgi:hypothetical protein